MLKFKRSELPMDRAVAASLEQAAPFRRSKLESNVPLKLLKFDMENFDVEKVLASTNEAIEIYGNWNYRLGTTKDGKDRVDPGYAGIGLTYNPDHDERENCDIHQQVQGNFKPAKKSTNPFSQLTPAESKVFATRNSHYDSYSLAYRTPASRHGELGKFLDTCKRTMVRTAVRTIESSANGYAEVDGTNRAGVGWHKDEAMFENLRVNIPLFTNENFVLEQEGHPAVHLPAGSAFCWDTGILHRAYAIKQTAEPFTRVHLMLGFSCWWDFNEETDEWTQNEFFGKKHPKDMLIDGDVIPGLKLDLDFSY